MGIVTNTTYQYVCDQCEKTVAGDMNSLGPGSVPPGWRRITPGEPEGDTFCSWTCVAAFAGIQAEVPR